LKRIHWGILLLLVCAFGCYNKKDYSLTEPHVAAILSLQSVGGATTLPADGASQLGLVAKISGNTDPDKRNILFTTSAGTLVGGTPDAASGGRVVAAAGNGQAPIQLQSSTQIQPAVVTAQVQNVSGVTATLTIQFVSVAPNDTIRFVSVPGGVLPADGATLTPFTVAVAPQLSNQTVTFKASAGTFVDNPVSVDLNNRATGHLMSPATIGNADVTATIGGLTVGTAVQFGRAFPNRITITGVVPQTVAAKDGVSAQVTAKLARDVGSVTPGAVATFAATDVNQNSVGFFSNTQAVTTDASGTVTTNFFPTAKAAPGPVTITVTTQADGGGTVSSSIVVEIVAM
jgi:riboflavin synthase alpha subunit